jgi:hypothetical protein
MGSRRFTRLTNGFSKKLDNHVAAAALYVAHYNLCRVHEALRKTPAKALGVSDRTWGILWTPRSRLRPPGPLRHHRIGDASSRYFRVGKSSSCNRIQQRPPCGWPLDLSPGANRFDV